MLQRTDLARLFIFPDEEIHSPAPCPVFLNVVEVDGVTQSNGDLTLAYAPDPTASGEFEEVAAFHNTKDRATASLIVRLEIDDTSALQGIHEDRCTFDAHFNVGECFQVAGINQFTKKEVWEDVSLTTFARSKGKSFDSAGIELVTETYGASIKRRYTVLNPTYYAQNSLNGTEFGDRAMSLIVPPARCCHARPGAVALVGSGGDNGQIAYTVDFGRNWRTFDTNTGVNFPGAGIIKNTAIFTDDEGHAYRIDLRSEEFCERSIFDTPTLIGFVSDNTVGIGVSNTPTAGRLYSLRNHQEFAETPVYTHSCALLNIYDAKPDFGFVIVDANNGLVWSKDGSIWFTSPAYAWPVESTPAGIALQGPGCCLLSASDFLYSTKDYGKTWTMVAALPYPGPLHVSNRHCAETAGWDATNGTVRIFRTTNAAGSWYEEPNRIGASLLNQGLLPSRLSTAPEDPNIVWIVGLNDCDPPVILGKV